MIVVNSTNDIGLITTDRVLLVMPHPDDEAVFCSGFIQFLNRFQIPLKVIVLTKGEASSLRFGLKPKDSLAKAREKEQKTAFAILGIKDFMIANIPDGKIESREKEVKQIIQNQILTFKPTHLVTLEPDGIYGHPDHVALSRFVRDLTKSPRRLLYATVKPKFVLPKAKHMAKINTIEPIKPEYELKLGFRDIITKLKALNAHASQFRNLKHALGTGYIFIRNKMLFREYFTYYDK